MVAPNVTSIAEIRRMLAERFPEPAAPQAQAWHAEWAPLDADGGAILLGAVAEVCGGIAVGRLFCDRVLETVRRRGEWAGLVDPGRTFDPDSSGRWGWERVLIVFPKNIEQAVKAADALLRDGNLRLVLLDLQAIPLQSLGRIPASTWHRFRQLVERSGSALVVLTPRPLVEAARVRITLSGEWSLEAMRRRRSELIAELGVQVFRHGRAAAPLSQSA